MASDGPDAVGRAVSRARVCVLAPIAPSMGSRLTFDSFVSLENAMTD